MRPFFMHRFEEAALALLRGVAGLMLMQHGVQKMFGWLGGYRGEPGNTAELLGRAWFAGVLETFVAALFVAGLFTRPVAFLLSGLMAFAYFLSHAPDGFWPIANGGELAALYSFVFPLLLRARRRPLQPRRHPGEAVGRSAAKPLIRASNHLRTGRRAFIPAAGLSSPRRSDLLRLLVSDRRGETR